MFIKHTNVSYHKKYILIDEITKVIAKKKAESVINQVNGQRRQYIDKANLYNTNNMTLREAESSS